MSEQISPEFKSAFRIQYTEHIDAQNARRRSPLRRWLLGGGIAIALVAGGGATAVATGILPLPGGEQVSVLANPVTDTFTGPGTLQLGEAPTGATRVTLELRCLTPGTFVFPDGASTSCAASAPASGTETTYTLPVHQGTNSIRIDTDPAARWTLTATYISSETTKWATNAKGESYGVANQDGTPDLVAVIATNGKQGYAYNDELNDTANLPRTPADAANYHPGVRTVPVYEEDGITQIGEFVITPGRAG